VTLSDRPPVFRPSRSLPLTFPKKRSHAGDVAWVVFIFAMAFAIDYVVLWWRG